MLVLNFLQSKIDINKGALRALLFVLASSFIASCAKDDRALTDLEKRGKTVYSTNCTSCHNPDPRRPGSLGPEVAHSSLELLQARVLHKTYPAGYKPKRDSKLMPELPFLEKDLPALEAYLKSFPQSF